MASFAGQTEGTANLLGCCSHSARKCPSGIPVQQAGHNNLDYNIELMCELLLSKFFGLFSTCNYIFKFDVVYI
jgi:hypothetical protein